MPDRFPAALRFPSPAERARTLAGGVGRGIVEVTWPEKTTGSVPHEHARPSVSTRSFRVQHLTDTEGRVVLLVPRGGELDEALCRQPASGDWTELPSVLDVLDVPPGRLALPRARLCMAGWVEPVPAQDQRALAAAVAAARPVGNLLDVGAGCRLYAFDVTSIQLTTAAGTYVVQPEDFAAAEPDPLYELEDDVVAHLEADHRDLTVGHALRQLPPNDAARLSQVSVVGLDRYGLDLLCAVGPEYRGIRAPFGISVADADSLAHALCELLHCPCGTRAPLRTSRAPQGGQHS